MHGRRRCRGSLCCVRLGLARAQLRHQQPAPGIQLLHLAASITQSLLKRRHLLRTCSYRGIRCLHLARQCRPRVTRIQQLPLQLRVALLRLSHGLRQLRDDRFLGRPRTRLCLGFRLQLALRTSQRLR